MSAPSTKTAFATTVTVNTAAYVVVWDGTGRRVSQEIAVGFRHTSPPGPWSLRVHNPASDPTSSIVVELLGLTDGVQQRVVVPAGYSVSVAHGNLAATAIAMACPVLNVVIVEE